MRGQPILLHQKGTNVPKTVPQGAAGYRRNSFHTRQLRSCPGCLPMQVLAFIVELAAIITPVVGIIVTWHMPADDDGPHFSRNLLIG